MPDVSKRLEKADKYLQKGKQDAALEEYFQVLQQDPQNDKARQTAADLCIGLGRTEDARRLLSTTFDRYSSTGDSAMAAAAFKKLARLGPPPVQALLRYAQLVENSNPREALDAYHGAAAAFASIADNTRALVALQDVVRLDPSAQNLSRLGTLASEAGDPKLAASSFLRVAEIEETSGNDALPFYRQAFECNPQDAEACAAYGRALLSHGQAAEAAEILGPLAVGLEAKPVVQELYGRALLAENRILEAEPFLWQVFQGDPEKIGQIADTIHLLLKSGEPHRAVELARKLEQHQRGAGCFRDFVALVRGISDRCAPSVVFLEYLCEVFNAANREHDYCDTLIQLFELYYAAGNFLKSATALDRAVEVDAYESGHEQRLEMLRGKVDASMFNTIAGRLSTVVVAEKQAEKQEEQDGTEGSGESNILEDLMLQAEIFLQYSMRGKALERLERIHKLFPREEENTQRLRELYLNAGYTFQYEEPARQAPPAAAPEPSAAAAGPEPRAATPPEESSGDIHDFTRVTEITRNIYRQGNVKGVLFAAVNDIGRLWHASRCVAALLTPGKPPSVLLEYCGPGVPQSEIVAMVKVTLSTQQATVERGVVDIPDIATDSMYDSVRSFVELLGIQSLLAVPLIEGEEHVGVVFLEQCDRQRAWRSNDAIILKTIADQMLLAVNNAKLRSLVRTLAVTEERSGLLKRSSYLDVLLSEVKRATQQQSTGCVLLIDFGNPATLVRELGDRGVEAMMEEYGQVITSHIRQTDVAVRYDVCKVALILADTPEKNTLFVYEKLRKLLAAVHIAKRTSPFVMTMGIAEGTMNSSWDPVDAVTEVINRVEAALESAHAQGGDKPVAIAWQLEEVAAG